MSLDPLRFTVPGRFERSKPYRRKVQEVAWSAVGDLPRDQAKEWPAKVVEVRIDSVGTASNHKAARQFANMLHGVIVRKSSIVRGVGYREDDLGPRIEVTVKKVE